jgi:hypothetical protein
VAQDTEGCDGKGSAIDICGVCDGDNSTCTCVLYQGYHINELDYLLLQEAMNDTLFTVDCLNNLFEEVLLNLQFYDGDLDHGGVIRTLFQWLRYDLQPYSVHLDDLIHEIDRSFGLPVGFTPTITAIQ